jgi:hypothetical protein
MGLTAALVLLAPPSARTAVLTADEIIARHLEALGGIERLKAIRTLRRSGRVVVPDLAAEIAYTETRMRPASIRRDEILQGLDQITAFDGRNGWRVRPFEGQKDPERMSTDEARGVRLAADIDSPLFDYRVKGHSVEYLGQEDLDGSSTYKLRVNLAWGGEATYWIDTDTLMVLRQRDRQKVRGTEQVTDTDFSDYEKIKGVWIPMTEEQGPQDSDSSHKRTIIYVKAEANAPVNPAIFAFPAPRAAETRP